MAISTNPALENLTDPLPRPALTPEVECFSCGCQSAEDDDGEFFTDWVKATVDGDVDHEPYCNDCLPFVGRVEWVGHIWSTDHAYFRDSVARTRYFKIVTGQLEAGNHGGLSKGECEFQIGFASTEDHAPVHFNAFTPPQGSVEKIDWTERIEEATPEGYLVNVRVIFKDDSEPFGGHS